MAAADSELRNHIERMKELFLASVRSYRLQVEYAARKKKNRPYR